MILAEGLPPELAQLTEKSDVHYLWARNYNDPRKISNHLEHAGVPLDEALRTFKWRGSPMSSYVELHAEAEKCGAGLTFLSASDLFEILMKYSQKTVFMLRASLGDGGGEFHDWTVYVGYPGDRIETYERPTEGRPLSPLVHNLN